MVLICADPSEAVTAFLCSRLKMLSIDHRVLDPRAGPDAFPATWSWREGRPSGSIFLPDAKLRLDELTGVYFRNVSSSEAGDPEEIDDIFPRTHPQIAAALNSLPCRVVNRPAATYSNRSKPYQALIIRQFGFQIPKTLITNDPAAVRRFYDECDGKVISKSISGARSLVQRINKDDLERELLEGGPTQFQEYLPGDNIRVHVIGERVFAVRIQCDAVDYRYAGREGYTRRMVPAELSPDSESNCIGLAKEFGLAMAGIDLKETPSGEYYCFEVNTSPAFPFYESLAQPVIADALAAFLAGRRA